MTNWQDIKIKTVFWDAERNNLTVQLTSSYYGVRTIRSEKPMIRTKFPVCAHLALKASLRVNWEYEVFLINMGESNQCLPLERRDGYN